MSVCVCSCSCCQQLDAKLEALSSAGKRFCVVGNGADKLSVRLPADAEAKSVSLASYYTYFCDLWVSWDH